MLGCHVGRCFQVTVAGGSYQDGLTAVIQGIPPGMLLTEQEIYGDMLLRKPTADELSSPRKEPDLPIIYTGIKDMTGFQNNDQIHSENDHVVFDSNHAGGITGGLATGQDIIVRLAVKPTPTIDKDQRTIDKYTLENKALSAITRRDPTIVGRIWPVAENYAAMIILDQLMAHYGYQMIEEKVLTQNK